MFGADNNKAKEVINKKRKIVERRKYVVQFQLYWK